jgi:hypothetical protein
VIRRRRRPGYLYEFWGYDPRALLRGTIKIICLYVGQTRQKPENRRRQHQFGSPNGEPGKIWYALVTEFKVGYRKGRVTDQWLDVREAGRVLKLAPVANINLNKANPGRIPPWEMKRLMTQINASGGVAALVEAAHGKDKARAGFHIDTEARTVSWYGRDAAKVGAKWLQPSTGSLSPSASRSESRSGSDMRRVGSGFTGRKPA